MRRIMTRKQVYSFIPAMLLALFLSGCVHSTLPLTKISAPMPQSPVTLSTVKALFGGYSDGNFSGRSWEAAFDAMHQKLSREYAFTEWKGVDWDALYDRFKTRLDEASANNDAEAYYLTLREYIYSIPDGSLSIATPQEYKESHIGGGYGFSLLPLEDGRVVIAWLDPESQAAVTGIQWGAEILEWNGLPINEALKQQPVLWNDVPVATLENEKFVQCALLTRAPVGTPAEFMFRNPGAGDLWITRLEARRDFMQGLKNHSDQGKSFTEFESPLESRILDGNIGYIRIYCHAATLAMPFPVRAFRKSMEKFVQARVTGLIMDLRGNPGGLDELAAAYAGHFTQTPLSFRKVVSFDSGKGGFALNESLNLYVEPRSPYFSAPVCVLINRNTREGGEALAAALRKMPKVQLVGSTATEGSYGLMDGTITMPGGHVIHYPRGRMLEEDGSVLVTAGTNRVSPVAPDVTVPYTMEKCESLFRKEEDPVLKQAIAILSAGEANSR